MYLDGLLSSMTAAMSGFEFKSSTIDSLKVHTMVPFSYRFFIAIVASN